MSPLEGLELVVIGRTRFFAITYEDGKYLGPDGKEVDGLMDVTCFRCGVSYYTLEGEEEIEFCPNCGAFHRREFKSLAELLRWARTQNWGFLQFSGKHAYAVPVSGRWELRFARKDEELYAKGYEDFQRIA